jgi:large subunit ribosomal protein L15
MMISDVLSRGKGHKARKRVGRGPSSGHGKTSGRGHKGLGQRAGAPKRTLAEGGALPLFRRLAKRGFSNAEFRRRYEEVNLKDLESRFDEGTHVTPSLLEETGLIRDAKRPVKVLGDGQISKKLKVQANRFSAAAARKIEQAGGQAEIIPA